MKRLLSLLGLSCVLALAVDGQTKLIGFSNSVVCQRQPAVHADVRLALLLRQQARPVPAEQGVRAEVNEAVTSVANRTSISR